MWQSSTGPGTAVELLDQSVFDGGSGGKMVLLERSAELAAVVRADVAFQDVQAASGLRNDQRGGEDGHVVPGDEVEDFQGAGDFPVRHDDQTVVLESRVQGGQFFGTERFRRCFQVFPGRVRVLEHKVFQIHHGEAFRQFFRDGDGEAVGVNDADGVRHGGMLPDDGGQGFRCHGRGGFKVFQGFVAGSSETPGFHAAGGFRKLARLFQGLAVPGFKPCGKEACGELFFVEQVVHHFPPYPMLSSISRSMSLRSSTEYSMGNS